MKVPRTRVAVIEHGLCAGAGAFVALSIIGTLIGPDYIPAIMIIAASVVITSALWAQFRRVSESVAACSE